MRTTRMGFRMRSLLTRRKHLYVLIATGAVLALPIGLIAAQGGAAAATNVTAKTSTVTTTSLGTYTPTFVGSAATGCASGCDLLSGPTVVPSTASFALGSAAANAAAKTAAADAKAAKAAAAHLSPAQLATVSRATGITTAVLKEGQLAKGLTVKAQAAADAATGALGGPHAMPDPEIAKPGPDPAPPSVSCPGLDCDLISLSSGGAHGVKGLNAVDSATQSTNVLGQDIEPADQGLCAGNGYVVESNNLGEVLFFNTRLGRVSSVIPLDTLMGLTAKNWSSGGDIMCQYDYSNGGHFFFTEFVSASSEASGGTFAGCFAGVANTCYEAIAVTKGDSPFGPYNVYDVNSDYNPAEPGSPYLLNDFTKIAVSRDAFLLFYDEFPLVTPGIGGGGFNGAQEYAFDKTGMERGKPAADFNVAIENMGTLPTPDGTCTSDGTFGLPGFTCWYSVIPAMPPDPSQYDNTHGGTAFMIDTLDYYGQGDSRLAVFAWTGLATLSSNGNGLKQIKFSGQLLSGVLPYYGEGVPAAQKAGPIPLGAQCGAAGLSVAANGNPAPASCPEGGVATNGDNFTQASQAQGQLWGAISTEVAQSFPGESSAEVHQDGAYYVIGTAGFDRGGSVTLTGEGYIAPAHEDISMPVIAAPDSGPAIVLFTLTGNGGPNGADHGGFYPSTAFGRLFAGSPTLAGSVINVADLGQSPTDGFTEYQGYPTSTRPRWGDYSAGIYDPATGQVYFATNYIQSPNCSGADFTNALGTCGGTRDYFANWGTSVNAVTP
jgi:hypothetical protein